MSISTTIKNEKTIYEVYVSVFVVNGNRLQRVNTLAIFYRSI